MMKQQKSKEVFAAVKNYSSRSIIQGLIYIFENNQSVFGRIAWTIVVLTMAALGFYW
jgi:hypothetical protein